MIIRYMVNGRKYLFATNFAQYQGNTSKEAESNYPAPQEEVDNWSRPGLDQVLTRSASDSDADADADTEDLGHRAENDTILPPAAPESPAGDGAIAPAIAVDWPDLGDLAAHDPVPRVKPAQKPVSHETRDFDTPGSRVLKAKLSANAASIGRSGPQRFRTLEQKRRFLESERRLGVVGLTQAITTALGSGVNTLDRIVAWVGKYNNGHGQISPRASPATPEVAAEPVPESGSIWGGKINGVG